MPALIAAWRAGFWPCAGGQHLAEDHLIDLARLDAGAREHGLDDGRAEFVRGRCAKAPLKDPTAVRAALAMTMSGSGMCLLQT